MQEYLDFNKVKQLSALLHSQWSLINPFPAQVTGPPGHAPSCSTRFLCNIKQQTLEIRQHANLAQGCFFSAGQELYVNMLTLSYSHG